MVKIEDIALTFVSDLAPRAVVHLLDTFGGIEGVYSASAAEMEQRAELRADIATKIATKVGWAEAERELRACEAKGIKLLVSADDGYPNQLRYIGDYPHIIYMVGDDSLIRSSMMCAVTGERNSFSSYGESVTAHLIEQLAELVPEVVVIGALESRIDAFALRFAHHFGLRTIGVADVPLAQIESQSYAHLADEVLEHGGLIISERGVTGGVKDSEAVPHHRIIAGMCRGVVVVEGHQVPMMANYADSYGRPLLAVPGRVTDAISRGTNRMIASTMAQMVCSGRDIVEYLELD